MNITVLGTGRWASFLAWYCAGINLNVLMWGRPGSGRLARLAASRENEYLKLPPQVALTDSIEKALAHSDTVLISINAQQLRQLASVMKPYVRPAHRFVLCMKGIETVTGLRLSEVLRGELGDNTQLAVWVGPGHPQDFLREIPNCMLIDSDNPELTVELTDIFSGRLIRFYYGDDLLGTEIGAAAKNVMGIAAGLLDGLGYSSLKGVLMARGAREISRLVKALGGNELTVYGLCHLGDYEATLFSPYSHNRRMGECCARGERYSELAEGVPTALSLLSLAERAGVELPICTAVKRLVHDGAEPRQVLTDLFMREIKREFYS